MSDKITTHVPIPNFLRSSPGEMMHSNTAQYSQCSHTGNTRNKTSSPLQPINPIPRVTKKYCCPFGGGGGVGSTPFNKSCRGVIVMKRGAFNTLYKHKDDVKKRGSTKFSWTQLPTLIRMCVERGDSPLGFDEQCVCT